MTNPPKAKSGADFVIFKATNCPVTVVPILAPIIIPTDWRRLISPAFTKPTVITVVAEEDWIKAVTKIPTKSPFPVDDVSFSIRV